MVDLRVLFNARKPDPLVPPFFRTAQVPKPTALVARGPRRTFPLPPSPSRRAFLSSRRSHFSFLFPEALSTASRFVSDGLQGCCRRPGSPSSPPPANTFQIDEGKPRPFSISFFPLKFVVERKPLLCQLRDRKFCFWFFLALCFSRAILFSPIISFPLVQTFLAEKAEFWPRPRSHCPIAFSVFFPGSSSVRRGACGPLLCFPCRVSPAVCCWTLLSYFFPCVRRPPFSLRRWNIAEGVRGFLVLLPHGRW